MGLCKALPALGRECQNCVSGGREDDGPRLSLGGGTSNARTIRSYLDALKRLQLDVPLETGAYALSTLQLGPGESVENIRLCAVWRVTAAQLINLLSDLAEAPCGQTVPETFISAVDTVYDAVGLDSPVAAIVRYHAKKLRAELASDDPTPVRKAYNPTLSQIVALELAVVDETSRPAGTSIQEVELMALELVKVHSPSRWNDISNADVGKSDYMPRRLADWMYLDRPRCPARTKRSKFFPCGFPEPTR